jgi:putative ATP-dependent endonuclease of the OLD family
MHISRIVVRNFRNFAHLDVSVARNVTCVIGENNTGKTNLLHAIRLAVDANLSSQYRHLLEQDVHSGANLTVADQVVVSVEFTGYKDSVNDCALLGCCEVEEDLARIHYRFRPRREVRELIEAGDHDGTGLSLAEDYHFELTGGGASDPAKVTWNDDLGSSLRFGDLQSFQVEYLPAIRDVRQSLRQAYESPLGRILGVSQFAEEEKQSVVDILRTANAQIEAQPTIGDVGEAIKESFANAAGEAFEMNVKLGMADPSFAAVARSLKVLLSNGALQDFEPARNGLGLNNVLYVSMLLEYFSRRAATNKAAGQLLLIEEPEAHLHPQLQRVLYATLEERPFQAILTTHSTHISSQAPVESFIVLTNDGTVATSSCVPKEAADLSDREAADLNRYLDATRSTLLYARKVMLVEGPAELFLIPVLVKQIMEVDLDRYGISVAPIYGTHFGVYAKLFAREAMRKKCAIVCDGDIEPDDVHDLKEDDAMADFTLDVEESLLVQVFQCPVTFERALTLPGTLPMLIEAARECGYVETVKHLEEALDRLEDDDTAEDDIPEILAAARERVLKVAERCGKARFAQIASKYVDEATELPKYVRLAVGWLMKD